MMPARTLATIVVGFVHDLAAGCWAAAFLAIFWLEGENGNGAVSGILAGVQRKFFFLGLGCMALVLLSGAGRTFTYVPGVYGSGGETARRRALLVKHLVLFTLFGLGTWLEYRMVYGP